MIDSLLPAVTLIAALGCGLMAGLFFAFSAAVMKALARLPAAEGMSAMQSINVAIINPTFLVAFLGTTAACIFLVVGSMMNWSSPGSAWLLAGGILYLVGSFMVTVVFNVPRNNSLAMAAPTDPRSSVRWSEYVTTWTTWNHVRTAASLLAAGSLTIGYSF